MSYSPGMRSTPRRRSGFANSDAPLLLVFLGVLLGLVSSVHWKLKASEVEKPEADSFLFHNPPPGPAQPPLATDTSNRFPDHPLRTLDGATVRLYQDGVAPAVVTEFLAFCPDCEASARLFPDLAREVVAAGQRVVNLAYMGHPPQVRAYLKDKDFGGPTWIDHEGKVQRHFGIGTFTVWLLDRDGTIRFQGPPAQARPHLAAHLASRR